MHKRLLKRKYDDHTKADNGTLTGKIQIICVMLDFARLHDKICSSQEGKMFLTKSLNKERKKCFLLDLHTDTKSARLIKEKRVLIPALKNRNY